MQLYCHKFKTHNHFIVVMWSLYCSKCCSCRVGLKVVTLTSMFSFGRFFKPPPPFPAGLGFSFCYTPSVAMVGTYFSERKALAFGISLSGNDVCSSFNFSSLLFIHFFSLWFCCSHLQIQSHSISRFWHRDLHPGSGGTAADSTLHLEGRSTHPGRTCV